MISFHKGHVLGTAAFLALPMAVLAPRGGSVILVLAAVAVLALSPANALRIGALPRLLTLAIGALVLWAVVSLAWTVDFAVTLKKVLPFAATVFAGLVLVAAARDMKEEERRFFAAALVAGFVLGLVVLVEEIISMGALIRLGTFGELTEANRLGSRAYPLGFLNRGVTVVPLLLWPAVLALWAKGKKPAAFVLWLLALATILFTDADAAVLGMAFGLAVFLVVLPAARKTIAGVAVAVVLSTLAAPAITRLLPEPASAAAEYPFLSSSAVIRLQIWNFAADQIAKKPLTGWGFEMSRSFSSRADEKWTVPLRAPDGSVFRGYTEPMPLHPHNAVLQWWLELGLVGAALAAAILFLILMEIRRGPYPAVAKAAAAALVIGALGTAAVTYGAWQNWWVSYNLLVAALMTGVLTATREHPEPPR